MVCLIHCYSCNSLELESWAYYLAYTFQTLINNQSTVDVNLGYRKCSNCVGEQLLKIKWSA